MNMCLNFALEKQLFTLRIFFDLSAKDFLNEIDLSDLKEGGDKPFKPRQENTSFDVSVPSTLFMFQKYRL